ncbi:MAG: PD-(D/E)XK nuclease family protein, partial [Bacteroidota bacterium]
EDLHQVQVRFLSIWQTLYDVYQSYRDVLRQRGLGYDGMAYRQLVEQLEAGEFQFPQPKLVFIGFNALSTAEERLMAHLLKAGQAIVFWDVDLAYFTPAADKWNLKQEIYRDKRGHLTGEEPGKFIREYHGKWKELDSRLIISDMGATEKQIYVTGVPLQVGQAQYLGNLLQDRPIRRVDYQQHAIVLADENLLFPVLYALPEHLETLNVTMGFPLRQTNIHDLLLGVLQLIRQTQLTPEGQILFAHREVATLINNPYLKAELAHLSEKIQADITQRNLLFLSQAELAAYSVSPLLAHIFQPPLRDEHYLRALDPWLAYLEEIFRHLLDDSATREALLETEYVFQFYLQFQQLREILLRYQPQLTLKGFSKLFQDLMQRARIPFEGEPLIGVQLMGFLETRVLDFEQVYVLASNEGKLPDTSRGNSFIPYNLRLGFRLPTQEEKDAIYAYHFYRLIQRAKEVHLIYDTVVKDGQASEVSRFIRQIRHFFRGHSMLKVSERLISTPAPYVEPQAILISADEHTRKLLHQTYIHPSGSPRALSATALTTYINCPLRFYFRYVAGLKEQEEVEESMQANTFGSVLHQAMEYLYAPFQGKDRVVSETELSQLPKRVKACVKQAFQDQGLGWDQQVRGKNYLLREVIIQQCQRVLQLDASGPPFQIFDLENSEDYLHELATEFGSVRLNGAFDRIDWLPEEGLYRILDYKTGHVDLKSRNPFEEAFTQERYKAVFQGYLYGWLFAKKVPEAEAKVGFYPIRQLGQGVQYLNGGKAIHPVELDQFEGALQNLIQQTFVSNYRQTEEESSCRYCPYQDICHRGNL